MNEHEEEIYPPTEAHGPQPHFPKEGRPANRIVGNQMSGDEEEAERQQHGAPDPGDRDEAQPAGALPPREDDDAQSS